MSFLRAIRRAGCHILAFAQPHEFKHERPSRVTFELEPFKGQVQLTIVHDDFDPGSKMFDSISSGWPAVLSSLKSLLETGRALDPWWYDEESKRAAAG